MVLVGVIDTPGFGDSRGLKENAGEIVRALSSEDYVNCICLTINGPESRMSATLNLRSLPSYFDRSFVTSDLLHHLPGEAAKRKILGHGTTQRKVYLSVPLALPKVFCFLTIASDHSLCPTIDRSLYHH